MVCDPKVAMMLLLSLWMGSCCISKVRCHVAYSTHLLRKLRSTPKLCPGLTIRCNGSYHPFDLRRQFPEVIRWKYLSEDFLAVVKSILLVSCFLYCCYERAYWIDQACLFAGEASFWHYCTMTHQNCFTLTLTLLLIFTVACEAGKLPLGLTFCQ